MVWRLLHLPSGLVCICHGNRDKCIERRRHNYCCRELIYGYTFLMNTAAAGAGFAGLTLVNGDLDRVRDSIGSGECRSDLHANEWNVVRPRGDLPADHRNSGVISGTISPAAGGSGVTVSLSGAESATAVADANGNYMFSGLPDGSYTVTPSLGGYTFSPVSQAVTMNGTNQTGVNFTAQTTGSTWSVSGNIGPAGSGGGATVTLSGSASGSTVADVNGNYTFAGVVNGSYTVTPSKSGYTFSPVNQAVNINGANQTGVNFTAQGTGPTWNISGSISPASAGTARQLR